MSSPTPTTMKGWRRELREAHEDSDLRFAEMLFREGAQRIFEEGGLKEAVRYLLDGVTNGQLLG